MNQARAKTEFLEMHRLWLLGGLPPVSEARILVGFAFTPREAQDLPPDDALALAYLVVEEGSKE